MHAIFPAGLICGVLDGISAMIVFRFFGLRPVRIFQGIASGLLGRKAFQGGAATTALGVALHFLIAFGAATVYYFASRRLPILLSGALVCGVLFGIAVHFFMQFVVIPLSAMAPRPWNWAAFLAGLLVHMIVVGPSISLTIQKYAG